MPLLCETCGKTYSCSADLQFHIGKRHNFGSMGQFFCSMCPKKYVCQEDLDFHVDKRHGGAANNNPASGQNTPRNLGSSIERPKTPLQSPRPTTPPPETITPVSRSTPLRPEDAPQLATNGEVVIVKTDYSAVHDDEIDVSKGDMMKITKVWKARVYGTNLSKSGRSGWIPRQFVTRDFDDIPGAATNSEHDNEMVSPRQEVVVKVSSTSHTETIATDGYQMLELASEDQEIGNLQPDSAVPRDVKDRYGLKPKTSSRNIQADDASTNAHLVRQNSNSALSHYQSILPAAAGAHDDSREATRRALPVQNQAYGVIPVMDQPAAPALSSSPQSAAVQQTSGGQPLLSYAQIPQQQQQQQQQAQQQQPQQQQQQQQTKAQPSQATQQTSTRSNVPPEQRPQPATPTSNDTKPPRPTPPPKPALNVSPTPATKSNTKLSGSQKRTAVKQSHKLSSSMESVDAATPASPTGSIRRHQSDNIVTSPQPPVQHAPPARIASQPHKPHPQLHLLQQRQQQQQQFHAHQRQQQQQQQQQPRPKYSMRETEAARQLAMQRRQQQMQQQSMRMGEAQSMRPPPTNSFGQPSIRMEPQSMRMPTHHSQPSMRAHMSQPSAREEVVMGSYTVGAAAGLPNAAPAAAPAAGGGGGVPPPKAMKPKKPLQQRLLAESFGNQVAPEDILDQYGSVPPPKKPELKESGDLKTKKPPPPKKKPMSSEAIQSTPALETSPSLDNSGTMDLYQAVPKNLQRKV